MSLDSHRNGVIEKIESFEEYILLDLESYEEFRVQGVQNDTIKSSNYIVVDNGLIHYLKLIKAIGILKDFLMEVLEDIVNKMYNSLNILEKLR